MALTSTITANALEPWGGKPTDYTPPRVNIVQTSGSAATQGGIEIFADPSASANFLLNSISLSITDPTVGSLWKLYAGTTQIAEFPTLGAGEPAFYTINFGDPGLLGNATTTTATVSLFSTGGTATVIFTATGKRRR